MADIIAVNIQLHKNIKVNRQKAEEAIADQHMLPVVVSEFLKLVVEFPILMSKNQETGHFVCIALLGFEHGENLFWNKARFNSLYSPLNVARHPFFVGGYDEREKQRVIDIDQDSHSISPNDGEALFTQDNRPSHYLLEIKQILAELLKGEIHTQAYIKSLVKHDLLMPLKLDITFADKSQRQIKGLYSIDEEKLNSISIEVLNELKHAGYLQYIYTQIASLGQIYALIERKNIRLNTLSPWLQTNLTSHA
ncbi:MAG: SapC family protein [Paraglaciecola sp.]|uniref:SapC family protein n=1 Tax=Paraglaciecola sp. TaxID=1920173 RepID=UPI00273E8254|nr:SapC family protein [Paraglaciecola sp.]MDP5032786.1 SapC family protein [Paraglaciecola sp.]MDP5130590.1 SapC family protein [Paraglaciecola sp.]